MPKKYVHKPVNALKFIELARKLGSNAVEMEWKYFQEWVRKYPFNSREQRYGILPMGADPSMVNMIYAHDTPELRLKHLECVSQNGMSAGHKVRLFVDWLEKQEGKQR